MKGECKQQGSSEGSDEPGRFLLIVVGSQATLAAPLLGRRCVAEGRERGHTLP